MMELVIWGVPILAENTPYEPDLVSTSEGKMKEQT
jgi:hypothetical protein